LHWDFRLEHDGVLVSWALPKGIPVDPATNHLAVRTEDHPLDYGTFEGDIPQGEYGAGRVSIWDHGTYDTEKWRDDEIMVVLHGARASGRFVLFATGDDKWMIHRMDPAPEGYVAMPEHVAPMLAIAGEVPPDHGWAFEFKWDGVRAIVYVDGGRVRALSRNDKSLAAAFPELRAIGLHLGSRSAILDGEIVALDDENRPDFSRLSRRLHLASKSEIERLTKSAPVSFFAFDLLHLDGTSLLNSTYDERRTALASLRLEGNSFATPPSILDARGTDVLSVAEERGLEGIVAKKRDASYTPGRRSGDWVKIKNFRTQEVVIGGWTDGNGERADSFGALLLGVPMKEGLALVGKVGTGFSAATRKELLRTLKTRTRKTSPFVTHLTPGEFARAHFVRPDLVGEVRFAEWTSDGRLRQPAWRGLRPDKSSKDVVREP
jgi:bifunctional non-homologous end joining protein LigD